jgi:hypothetical protein
MGHPGAARAKLRLSRFKPASLAFSPRVLEYLRARVLESIKPLIHLPRFPHSATPELLQLLSSLSVVLPIRRCVP